MDNAHELLLNHAGRLYERHETARQSGTRFNLFNVLRNSSDEVNLHSRFLYALLNHRATPDGEQENLRDFLADIASVEEFRLEGASVARETHNIDLLIANREQAIVIENKIWAGDQERQLQRYQQKLVDLGYDPSAIRLLYLTPFGTAPSEQSIGHLEYKTVSYRDDLPRWLKRCQQRAVNDPSLRESIAQYLQLIRTITGTDYSEAYMADLKKLCLKDDNLILMHDLSHAFVEAKADLVVRLWSDIDEALRNAVDDLPELDPKYACLTKSPAVKDYVNGRRGSETGLYYRIDDGAWFAVAADPYLWFGVSCNNLCDPERRNELLSALSVVRDGRNNSWTPWYRYADENLNLKNLSRDDLRLLMSETARSEFAETVSAPMAKLRDALKDARENGKTSIG